MTNTPSSERRWVLADDEGRLYRVTVRAPGAPAFDDGGGTRGIDVLLGPWLAEAFDPSRAGSASLLASLEEICAALTLRGGHHGTDEAHTSAGSRRDELAKAVERAAREGALRCERLRQGLARPELEDDLPATVRAPLLGNDDDTSEGWGD